MRPHWKLAPPVLFMLFGLILAVEVFSFFVLAQWAPVIRFLVLCLLMILTLNGVRIAKLILLFLLSAGGALLIFSALTSAPELSAALLYYYLPSLLFASTVLYIIFSKRVRAFLSGKALTNEPVSSRG